MPPSISQVRKALPPFTNSKVTIKQRQGTEDIINEIAKTHRLYETDYDRIYMFFDTGNIYSTCRSIWEFLKYNLIYDEETKEEQSVKSPAAILQPGERIDCKHYSLFAGGVLDAIKQNEGDAWNWCYRFATDKIGELEPTHVFVVVTDKNREIWIDPCLASFDQKKKWYYYKDKSPMALVRISGTTPQPVAGKTVTVNKGAAWVSFLGMVTNNVFNIRTILLSSPDITHTKLKDYCIANNFDYDQLLRFLGIGI